MIRFLLQEIEKSINPIFTKKELLSISPEDFEDLVNRKILHYFRPADGDMEMLRFPRCPHGCPLTVVRAGDILEAVCPEHPEEDPVPVEKDDLNRYAFSVDKFLFALCKANRIEGEFHRIDGGYFYMGYKTYNNSRVGFIFAPRMGDGQLVKLSGLKRLCEEDDVLVVLTSASKIEDVILKRALQHDSVVQTSLTSCLDLRTFEIPVEELISGLLRAKTGKEASIRELSQRQKEDYERFEYKCHDRIHIPGTIPMKRSNLITVNGNEIKVGDSLFILLLRLVLELKRGNGGWVNIYDLESEGAITNSLKYQVYSNLRMSLAGSLEEKDGQRFVQNDGSGNYRISTRPDFATYRKERLQNHQDHRIRKLAEKLP